MRLKMKMTNENAEFIELDAMRLLANSGTYPMISLVWFGPGWSLVLQAPKQNTYLLRSQRSDSQPRYFKTAESAFKTAKSIGMSKVLVMLDMYKPDQESMI
jgi:secreted trypsin-like serine protease